MKVPVLLGLLLVLSGRHSVAETNDLVAPSIVTAHAHGFKVNSSTGVSFHTTDVLLQHLFDTAESNEAGNVIQFTPTVKILVEGAGYNNAWLETQPMGGEMYAKRNVQVALNNQLIFMLAQRADGRLPGMVKPGEVVRKSGQDQKHPAWMTWLPKPDILADYEALQGYCFPDPAWKMYFWSGRNHDYLRKLYSVLETYDAYLWRTRDSNGDGLLETWCVEDTGEDNSTRFTTRNAPTRWPFDFSPADPLAPDPQDPASFKEYWYRHSARKLLPPICSQVLVPFASMDIMAYSYDGRATLAKISRELGNGREDYWRQRAEEVRQRLIKRLWDSDRHACFDHDRYGKVLPELLHNNLRAMYHGIFTQRMADAFIRDHLLNPAEFWTPLPLPSVAIHEPLYRSGPNNWSGQPEGLTYQRAIRALDNYGHFAEVTLLGRKLIDAINRGGDHFPQQFDPFTGLATAGHADNYGPTLLSVLEYCSLMHGISLDVEHDQIWWSGLVDGGKDYTYTQRWGDRTWTLTFEKGNFIGRLNDQEVFSCTAGVRVVTDFDGQVREAIGIDSVLRSVTLIVGDTWHKLTVAPNQVVQLDGTILQAAPFEYPYHDHCRPWQLNKAFPERDASQ
jgi:hypothetical protein